MRVSWCVCARGAGGVPHHAGSYLHGEPRRIVVFGPVVRGRVDTYAGFDQQHRLRSTAGHGHRHGGRRVRGGAGTPDGSLAEQGARGRAAREGTRTPAQPRRQAAPHHTPRLPQAQRKKPQSQRTGRTVYLFRRPAELDQVRLFVDIVKVGGAHADQPVGLRHAQARARVGGRRGGRGRGGQLAGSSPCGQAGRLGAADTKCTHVGVQCPWPAAYNGRRSVTIAWMSVVVKRFFMAAAVPSTG